jgi:mRNA interferase HigB
MTGMGGFSLSDNRSTTSPYVKHYQGVNIITEKHLKEVAETYKDAAGEIKAWKKIVKATRWRRFEEVKAIFTDADPVEGYVVFDFRNNRYRLITVIHYVKTIDGRPTQGRVFIRSFLTHKECNDPQKWDPYRRKK